MKAMILAAGLGTRLRPLTLKIPKALIPVANRPLMDRNIDYLKTFGITEIVMNAHHHCEQIIRHINNRSGVGIKVQVSVEPEILGTGGGIKKTMGFWGSGPFLVVNGDIVTDIDINKALETHKKAGNLATLVLHDCRPFNKIQIDRHFNILEIPFERCIEGADRYAFTGIHIIEPELLTCIPDGFSDIIDCYRKSILEGRPIGAYVATDHCWRDIGTVESYVTANKEAIKENRFLTGQGCQIHDTVILKDWAVIGNESCIEQGAEIKSSVLWNNVTIKESVKIVDSVITSSGIVSHDMINQVY